ncbi:poly(p)/ATP NAD kinase, putative [Entamoeba dispar SAW760]|uniref:Poly(P)/ATP NAD kinase, putative n=1 Tax=Entamoeba dispar (strain ATCC PRA-260 / SAW760) TaxID=370354 RepID=B0E5X9_ENTDS|nr:poly(p)/ATP NAD kinase, putative [Entamoeba dispar SAW760]EDR30097.1 poly(p)/ATP NAD kinase, putative [Entamoeba dispar SAW760]|eukprot:EDR30097.1 poly(p)/ATP NAD kinase, putative [Entamoeba dispar SAW760]
MTTLQVDHIRAKFHIDDYNQKAPDVARQFERIHDEVNPNVVMTFGGDGTFLKAFHENYHLQLPYLGINCGNLGYLINPIQEVMDSIEKNKPLKCYSYPCLKVDASNGSTQLSTQFAFNDAWIERLNGQCCWFEVIINGVVRIPKLCCDGIVVCTPAGSTGYSKSIGVMPIPPNANMIGFVPNNASYPLGIRPLYLPLDTEVIIKNIQPNRRKTRGFYDGVELSEITELKIKVIENGCRVIYAHEENLNKTYINKVTKGFFE